MSRTVKSSPHYDIEVFSDASYIITRRWSKNKSKESFAPSGVLAIARDVAEALIEAATLTDEMVEATIMIEYDEDPNHARVKEMSFDDGFDLYSEDQKL